MDELLTRMLDVERQAADIVSAAEAEAERVQEAGRREALAEQTRLRQELDERIRQHIEDRVAAAEKEREEALSQADRQVKQDGEAFARAIEGHTQDAVQALAFAERPDARTSQ